MLAEIKSAYKYQEEIVSKCRNPAAVTKVLSDFDQPAHIANIGLRKIEELKANIAKAKVR